jgi:hypothetical protein
MKYALMRGLGGTVAFTVKAFFVAAMVVVTLELGAQRIFDAAHKFRPPVEQYEPGPARNAIDV